MASETKFKETEIGMIPKRKITNYDPWPVVEVQEVCDLIVDCVNKTAPTVDYITPYKMIRTTNIRSGKIDLTTCRHVEADTYKRWTRRAKVKAGDVLLTREAPIGEVGYVSCDDTTFLGQRIMQYRANPKVLDSRYLHYSFLSPALRYQFGVHEGSGSVVSHIRVGDCYKFKIPLPPLTEQTVIANILGTLDDKIDLNRQMNSTLEQIAQTLFKHWFIDFEFPDEIGNPYKSSGGRMEDSELGEIPEGWEVGTVGDIAEIIDCLHSKKPERTESGKPLLQLCNIRDDGLIDMEDTYYISESDYNKWISRIEASFGDCVITNVGRVGAVSQVPEYVKAALGRNMTAIRCNSRYNYPTYLIELLLSDYMKNEISLKTDDGTVMSALNVKNIPRLSIIIPSKELLQLFEYNVRPLRDKMEVNHQQSMILRSIRDSLLPKLMSRKIRVEC